jgi:hypothetical protein
VIGERDGHAIIRFRPERQLLLGEGRPRTDEHTCETADRDQDSLHDNDPLNLDVKHR